MPLTRRQFVQLGAAAVAARNLPADAAREEGPPTAPIARAALRVPGHAQAVITGGPALQQQRNSLEILAGFDDDALLKPYRAMGGQPAPGRNLGGWYEYLSTYNWHTGDAGFAPGHCFGQWTAAMTRFAAMQANAEASERLRELQRQLGRAVTPAFFDTTRFPAYTLDKLHYGLLDAHTLLASADAFNVLDAVHRCALPSLPGTALDRENHRGWRKDRDESYGWDESYTLPEQLYLLYAAGAGPHYRTMAQDYLLESFFAPLSRDENVLGGLHAYSHVNALCSAMQAWFVDGSAMHLKAAQNGYRMIEAQSFATGGWGPDELFERVGSAKLRSSLTSSHNSFETPCGTFAQMKLARYLLQETRDAHYGDAVERLLWNAMFGALPLEPDGRTFYYQDNHQSATRVYSAHRWPCCAGTFAQVTADYGVNCYLLDPEPGTGVWVTHYLPSHLRWQQGDTALTLEQVGDYPADEKVQLHLRASRPARFALHLRLPSWCQAPELRVNEKSWALDVSRGFALIDRFWRNGDRIELSLPTKLQLVALPSDDGPATRDLAALRWGPWVLMPVAPAPSARETELLQAERIGSSEWLVRRRGATDLFLRPFFAVGDGTYATYIRLV